MAVDWGQIATALIEGYGAYEAGKPGKVGFANVPKTPEEKALYDKALGYLDNSPTRNLLYPMIGAQMERLGNSSWTSPKTIGGFGLPEGIAGQTGYSGSPAAKFDWAAFAAQMAPQPATRARPPKGVSPGETADESRPGALGGDSRDDGGGQRRRGQPGGMFEGPGMMGGVEGRTGLERLQQGEGTMLDGLGGRVTIGGVLTAERQFGKGPVRQVLDAIRNNPGVTAAAIGVLFGPVVGAAANVILRAVGPSTSGSGDGSIPGSTTGSDAGRGLRGAL